MIKKQTFGVARYRSKKLELNGEMQSIADIRCSDIYVPGWIDLVIQPQMISNLKGLKSCDWKQVSTGTTF